MGESIYDLVREAELLKASLSQQQQQEPPDSCEQAWLSRQRLEAVYRQALLCDLRVALECRVQTDMWNCVFRNQIASLQDSIKRQEGPQRDETAATLSIFLESACCFYYQLLQALCYKHNTALSAFLSPDQLGVCHGTVATAPDTAVCEVCQECLLRLGDVARYNEEWSLAEKYYRQADGLLPGRGIISNQLGLVASHQGHFYKAAFHYSHTVVSRYPFPPSRINLEQIFETHARNFPDQITDILSFQTGLLYLLSLLYSSRDLPFLSLLLPKLLAPLPAFVQQASAEFLLSTVGLCLFACETSFQPLAGLTSKQATACLTAEEEQKCRLSLQLLLETSLVLVSCTLPLSHPLLRSLLPFIAVVLHWIVSHIEHIPFDQLTQLPLLWTGLSDTINQLYLKSGFEASIDTTQRLREETALVGFIGNQDISSFPVPSDNEHLCLAKVIVHIKAIIRDKLFGYLSLASQHGIYQLTYTPPPVSTELTSPTLSPLFSSPILNNSLFPSIWSDTPLQQNSTQPVTSTDTIKSLWNASDALSQ